MSSIAEKINWEIGKEIEMQTQILFSNSSLFSSYISLTIFSDAGYHWSSETLQNVSEKVTRFLGLVLEIYLLNNVWVLI